MNDDESTPGSLGASSASGADETPAQRPGDASYAVLLVEDDEDAAMLTRLLLEAAGHDVSVARSGPTAIEAARGRHFDTVLLDLGLPDMPGEEVLRALKEQGSERTRFICLSGQREHDVDWRALGFDHYLEKPVPLDTLRTLLGPKMP